MRGVNGVTINVPSGVMFPYGGTVAPEGWMLCNGSSLLRADYPSLFAAIGTAFGTASADHFNLPDTRGRFLRGKDGAVGRDPDSATRTASAAGGNTGDNVGSVQVEQTKSHAHMQQMRYAGTGATAVYMPASAANAASALSDHTNTKVTGGNETRPINLGVEFIIKL